MRQTNGRTDSRTGHSSRVVVHWSVMSDAASTPRAAALVGADRPEREVALRILPRALRGETVVCDKGYAGREFAGMVAALGTRVVRPARRNEPDQLALAACGSVSHELGCPSRAIVDTPRSGAASII